ncbi:MAG TPA: sulfur carrier protein ThiS [Gammaproteobacteria bacterium]|nr:sulfur carrier protein ThiS [Gammaproteobacteria bacterium]
MEILLNGASRELAPDLTLTELLDVLELAGRRVAIELNGQVVPASEHAQRKLSQGDRVELISAIGGG